MKWMFTLLCVVLCITGICQSNEDNAPFNQQLSLVSAQTYETSDSVVYDSVTSDLHDLDVDFIDEEALTAADKMPQTKKKWLRGVFELNESQTRILWISIGITLLQLAYVLIVVAKKNGGRIPRLDFRTAASIIGGLLLMCGVLFIITWSYTSTIGSRHTGLRLLILAASGLLVWGFLKLLKKIVGK